MKKRIIAIALVLMLAVSLLPASAMAVDVPISVSVDGKYFTQYNQTINVGGGTATLGISSMGLYPELTLKNVNIGNFAEVDTGNGNTVYAGIAFSGYTIFYINLEGNNTITAPTDKKNGIYVGVLGDNSAVISNPVSDVGGELSRASLTINNTDIGVIGLFPSERCYLAFSNLDLIINNAAEIGIQCANLDLHGCNTSISSACCGILANSVQTTKADYTVGGAYDRRDYSRPSNTAINVSSDTAPEGGGLLGVVCERLSCEDEFNVNVSYKCKGNEKVFCCGVNAGTVSSEGRNSVLNAEVNLQGNENSYAVGIVADTVALYSQSFCGFGKINASLNLNGEHGQSMGVFATDVLSENRITSRIAGADIYDIPVCADNLKLTENGALYAETDCKNPVFGAVLLKNYETDYNITIHWPTGGLVDAETDGETVKYCVDEEGNPAQYFIVNNMGYPFIDIDGSGAAPYKDAILWAMRNSITNGFNPMEFCPSAACTRGQIVTFLWRAKDCPDPTITENPFVDVAETSPYYKAILWAYENEITKGFDDTHFKPSNPCTRGQVATFLWRDNGKNTPQSDENPFKDVSKTGNTEPYYDAILWAAENGITTGYSDSTFRPSATCNRGQIVTFIYREVYERSMNAKGNLVDVIIDVAPDAVFDESCYPEIRLSSQDIYAPSKKGETWDFVPVNFTYVFEDGSCDNITMYLKSAITDGELSVNENWVQLLTVKGTKAYLAYGLSESCQGMKYGYLLVADAKKSNAEFIKDFRGDMQVYGDYIVATQQGTRRLHVYNIANGKYGTLMERIHFETEADVMDYAVYGDYLLYWCNITAEGIRVGGIYMDDICDSYGQRIGDYYRCESFTHDETGFTVVYHPDKNGDACTLRVEYPPK